MQKKVKKIKKSVYYYLIYFVLFVSSIFLCLKSIKYLHYIGKTKYLHKMNEKMYYISTYEENKENLDAELKSLEDNIKIKKNEIKE